MSDKPSPLVAVTGATGYVGSHLCAALSDAGYRVRPLAREAATMHTLPERSLLAPVAIGDIAGDVDWSAALAGVDVVVHAAGIAHRRFGNATEAALLCDRVNRDATKQLADAAITAGVKRFCFLSSVGVYGPVPEGRAAVETDTCSPEDPYARSKREAELLLLDPVRSTRMEIAILRPPMVYGPDCPGNLPRLASMLRKRVPLPLGGVRSRRHLIGIDNLSDFVVTLLSDPDAIGGVWNVVDNEDVDLPTILACLAQGMDLPIRLVRIPEPLLRAVAGLLGQRIALRKLSRSIRVDGAAARDRFGWRAPHPPLPGLTAAGRSFAANRR